MIRYYWSRTPGKFVDKTTGDQARGAFFVGSTREWYETLVEVIIDVLNVVHRQRKDVDIRDVRIHAHPDVDCILQSSVLHAKFVLDGKVNLVAVTDVHPERDKVDLIDTTTGEVVGQVVILDLPEEGFLAHLLRIIGIGTERDR